MLITHFNYIFVIGKNPALSQAELNSVFQNPDISILSENTVLLKLRKKITNPQNLLNKLGGTIKICQLLTAPKSKNLPESIIKIISEQFSDIRHIGFSYYNFRENLNKTLINIKKELKENKISKRFIFENDGSELSAATIKKNKLLSKGSELVIIKTTEKFIFGQTIAHQDVDSYTLRDFGKPKPDSRSGMLPPKLAQIMINLANPKPNSVIYDPFCGSGIVLQEAILMNLHPIGSDISEKAVIQTRENLKWLIKKFNLEIPDYRNIIAKNIFIADATYYQINHPVDCIVTEPYLGPAHRQIPSDTFAKQIIHNLTPLYQNFLSNSVNNVKKSGRIVFVLPIIKTTTSTHSVNLNTLLDDDLSKAYNIIQFGNSDLIYKQPNQIVTRKLIILEKN